MGGTADVVVVGAGIAGVSAAYHLAVAHDAGKVVIVDPRPPLTLTSDKSSECYRNWWPNAPMVGLMSHSIDLLEEMTAKAGEDFGMVRRGYLYLTADPARLQQMVDESHFISTLGAGPVRIHPGPIPYRASPAAGFNGSPEGADILVGSDTVRSHFPFITPRVEGAVHVRRAGWFSAQQLGAWMLERAREAGVEVVAKTVTAIPHDDSVNGVEIDDGSVIESPVVVVAGGPMSKPLCALADVELPVFAETHLKISFRDHLGIIPRDAPMFIWGDPQEIDWSDEERAALAAEGRHDLLGGMPIFCHGRPEGGADSPFVMALWEYHNDVRDPPTWPLMDDPLYPEVVMRGLTTMVPGLAPYLDGLPHAVVDGGYYIKTRENRPLIGPSGPEGLHLMTGMSGFGVMVAAGAGDLLARHVTGGELPGYADSFLLSRYENPAYLESIADSGRAGQL